MANDDGWIGGPPDKYELKLNEYELLDLEQLLIDTVYAIDSRSGDDRIRLFDILTKLENLVETVP